jgi:hypothetical protein
MCTSFSRSFLIGFCCFFLQDEALGRADAPGQCMFGVAGVISNILAYGFYHVQGAAIKSWQIFNVTIGKSRDVLAADFRGFTSIWPAWQHHG